MNLVWVLATIESFSNAEISITTERKSINQGKAIKHVNKLTADELEAIRYDSNFAFLDDETCNTLMQTEEWNQ